MIPERVKSELQRYLCGKAPPGGFLRAVLENDLLAAAQVADTLNAAALVEIAKYVYLNTPRDAWGSPARVQDWLAS